MDFLTIQKQVEGVPYILPELSRDIYSFIVENKPQHCLELGFGHGASSCYIAAALDEVGAGHLSTVDLYPAQVWQHPTIEELLKQSGLEQWVSVHRENTSYTWFLKKKIYENSAANCCTPIYDFCFIDGSKNWTIDSSAFFLVDKLLKPGGWILFDDLQWTYHSKLKEGKRKTNGVYMLDMGDDELHEPHLELIFQLLVMQHPDYSNFTVKDNWWGWAQKIPDGRKVPEFILSENYAIRLAAKEREMGRPHRAPFQPFPKLWSSE